MNTNKANKVADLMDRMYEAKDIGELNRFYNEAEDELFITYGTLMGKIFERVEQERKIFNALIDETRR